MLEMDNDEIIETHRDNLPEMDKFSQIGISREIFNDALNEARADERAQTLSHAIAEVERLKNNKEDIWDTLTKKEKDTNIDFRRGLNTAFDEVLQKLQALQPSPRRVI